MEYDVANLLEKAAATPPKSERLRALYPVIKILREEKKLQWDAIQAWLTKETGEVATKADWCQKFYKWKQEEAFANQHSAVPVPR